MSSPEAARPNPFLSGPIGPLFARTAAPIILIMLTNGVQTLIDAWFLGAYVGADALAAVTLMFPLFMLMSALATLVSFGMASALARALGAGDEGRARAIFAGAHGLSLVVCALLIVLFALGGWRLALGLANGSLPLATMGHDYIAILIWCSPVMFLLGVNGDALRCEGRLSLMTLATLVVSAANIALTWLLVARLGYGVAGSAIGTVLAQALALSIVVWFRLFGRTTLRWTALRLADLGRGWGEFLSLGAPQSLSFIGISLVAGAIIVSAQRWAGDGYAATVAAYGIITRIMTFAYMVLMGLNMATQTVVGNNFGAGLWQRSDGALKIGLAVAVAYAATFEIAMLVFAGSIGGLFVDDAATIAEVARILPITIVFYALAGGMLVLSGYLQAIGDARTAILLTIGRTYLFTIPLVVLLPFAVGEIGIWLAGPVSELLTAVLAAGLLWRVSATSGYRWGLLRSGAGMANEP
jgi:putative MATE family efflux protein